MASYVRLDNSIIRRRAEGITHPDDVGLFALLSVYLSIPDFRTPNGGLHAAIQKHCSNGRHTVNAAWQRLSRAGYLKRTRLPDEHYQLRDIYALHSVPDAATPAVHHLDFAHAHRAWAQHRSFTPPTDHFTPVSTAAIMDPRLSLAAKGLYALIRQRLLLSSRVRGVTLNREGLRRASGLGECAFRRIWKELRDNAYLSLTHVWDGEQKKMVYLYSLAEELEPMTETSEPEDAALPAPSLDKPAPILTQSVSHSVAQGATQSREVSYESLKPIHKPDELSDMVRDQIEYDVLLTRDNPPPLLDCAVEVISRIMRLPPGEVLTIRGARYSAADVQGTLAALDANEAEFAVQAVKGAVDAANRRGAPIRNLRAYLLACLFTAKTDFATSLIY